MRDLQQKFVAARALDARRRVGPCGSLRAGGSLPAALKLNLAFLVGLAALAFFLPLSGAERLFLAVSVAVLAGVNWSLLERARG
jgi:hypothetical protein